MDVDPMRRVAMALGRRSRARSVRPAGAGRGRTSASRFHGGTSTGRNFSREADAQPVETARQLVEDRIGRAVLAELDLLLALGRIIAVPPAVLEHGDAGLALKALGERLRGALRHHRQRERQFVARGKLQQPVRAPASRPRRRRRATRTGSSGPRSCAMSSSAASRARPASPAGSGLAIMRPDARDADARSFRATKSMPGSEENFFAHMLGAGACEPQAELRDRRISRRSPRRARADRFSGTSQPVDRCVTSSGMPETSVASTGTAKACASISTLGSPSRSPDRRRAAREARRDRRGASRSKMKCAVLARRARRCGRRCRAAPPAPSAASRARRRRRARSASAGRRAVQRQRRQEVGIALLLHGAADRDDGEASRRRAPSARRRRESARNRARDRRDRPCCGCAASERR